MTAYLHDLYRAQEYALLDREVMMATTREVVAVSRNAARRQLTVEDLGGPDSRRRVPQMSGPSPLVEVAARLTTLLCIKGWLRRDCVSG